MEVRRWGKRVSALSCQLVLPCGLVLLLIFSWATIEGAGQTAAKPTANTEAAHSKSAAPPRPVRVISDLSQFHLDRASVAVASTANQIGAGTRGGGDSLVLCAPSLGMTSTTHPIFEWRDRSGASRVTFTLLSEAGDVLYEGEVARSPWKYPDTAARLEPGQRYAWKVSGNGMDGLPAPARFEVQSQASQQKTSGQLDAQGANVDPLARAQVFMQDGLWYDTVATLESAAHQYPGRNDLVEQLQVLYKRVAPGCADGSTR